MVKFFYPISTIKLEMKELSVRKLNFESMHGYSHFFFHNIVQMSLCYATLNDFCAFLNRHASKPHISTTYVNCKVAAAGEAQNFLLQLR